MKHIYAKNLRWEAKTRGAPPCHPRDRHMCLAIGSSVAITATAPPIGAEIAISDGTSNT
jgi:hypothetical protein